MKKIVFLLAGILLSFGSFAQRVAFNKSVAIGMPKNLSKITKQQAIAHAKDKFKGDKMLAEFYADADTINGHLYKIDDIVVEIRSVDTTYNFGPGYATNFKKGQDEAAHGSRTYTSSLKMINGNSVVITNSTIGNIGYCFFFCFNAKNTRTITGRFVFDKEDKEKATTVLDHILNGIKFKD